MSTDGDKSKEERAKRLREQIRDLASGKKKRKPRCPREFIEEKMREGEGKDTKKSGRDQNEDKR